MASDLNWYKKRLAAMEPHEITWRIFQTLRYKQESIRFKKQYRVTAKLFNRKYSRLQAEPDRLGLNLRNEFYTLGTSIPLLGDFKYEDYKKDWFQGFGGKGTSLWPMVPSSKLNYRERNDIGDARMNWELNKHFQFAMLAKNYYASSEAAYLNELVELFNDWNDKNPFLWGISWVSAIEIAERTMNWCYMYAFLEASLRKEFHNDHKKQHKGSSDDSALSESAIQIQTLLEEIRIGILNMADYISHHYSQFSSANNHLIVEISAVLHAGILFNYEPWVKLAEEILTREIFLQNYSDGINKEESEYYQTFEMEVLALDLRLFRINGIETSKPWDKLLRSMSKYISNSIGNHGEVISFGDDDDGRIIDFHGGCNHFKYTLELMGLLLDERYTELKLPESSSSYSDVNALTNSSKSKKKSKHKHGKSGHEVSNVKASNASTISTSDTVASNPISSDSVTSEVEKTTIFSSPISETVLWLFSKEDIIKSQEKNYYRKNDSVIRPEGGMTVFRSEVSGATPDILIGIDHAPLGYGSIAAHGHSDALSFQMFADGTRIFADPGTYIYHCDTESRNDFRRTSRHNTVCINGADQSEMLGPFLWGRKANCWLDSFSNTDDTVEVIASHDGYSPVIHSRKFTFKKKEGILFIEDWLTKEGNPFTPDASHSAVFNLLLGEKAILATPTSSATNTEDSINPRDNAVSKNASVYNFNTSSESIIVRIEFISGFGDITHTYKDLSTEYGIKTPSPAIEAPIISDHAVTKISLVRK